MRGLRSARSYRFRRSTLLMRRETRDWRLRADRALDVLARKTIGLHPPLHPTRLLTGFLLGWTATALLVSFTSA